MVTLDRVRRIDVEADYGVWKEYARERKLHGALLSYLELRPNNFYRVEADVDGLQYVTARGWEDLSQLIYAYEELSIPVTEEVIYEFLHHRDVAEDVEAYLALYHKYQDDYGIPEILAGNVRTEVYARLFQAGFDERLSVVGLLADGLRGILEKVILQKNKTDQWYDYLRQYQHTLKEGTDKTPAEDYRQMLETIAEENAQLEKTGLVDRKELSRREILRQQMAENAPSAAEPREAFAQAKQGFDNCRSILAAPGAGRRAGDGSSI